MNIHVHTVCLRRHVADLRSKTLSVEDYVRVIQWIDLLLLCNHGDHSFEVNLQETISQAILLFVKIRAGLFETRI